MKVLHVIDALGLGGGAEHSLAALLPLLRDRGVESVVVTLVPRAVGLQGTLRDEGFDVRVLPSMAWPARIRDLRTLVLSEAPDVVHATLFNACLATRLATIGVGIPRLNSLVNTSYDPVRIADLGIAPWKMGVMRRIDGFTARHLVDCFHTLTDAVADEAVDVLGVDRSKITVIPRGRSTAALGRRDQARRHDVRVGLGLEDDVPLVLTMGRQDDQKGHAGLVRAFATVVASHPRAQLLIAGRDGSATPALRQAIAASAVAAHIHELGHRSDAPDLYAAADIFAFPSLYEGLGCSLIEAMALEAPIVGSDAPAIDEVLEHGELGVVVPRGDDVALGRAISDLLDDPARRGDLGRRGRARFEERYEIDRVADATVELYRSLVSR